MLSHQFASPEWGACLCRTRQSAAVPLHWTIDHDLRLVVVRVEGDLTIAHLHEYLEALVAANAMPYGKLFDLSGPPSKLTLEELRALGARMRDYGRDGTVGPLALVVDSGSHWSAATFADAAGRHRPIQVFRDREEAMRWLAERMVPGR